MKVKNLGKMLALGLVVVATALTMVSCKGGSHRRGDIYYRAWYDVYGYQCGSGSPSAGCNFYSDGTKIIDLEDPYYSNSNILSYELWSYYDSYGYYSEYIGYAWLSPTGILYDEWGNALNQAGKEDGRDVIADVAEQEAQKVAVAGKAFAKRFALSEEAGTNIAKTLNAWANLGKKRARTEADMAAFAGRLYGVNMEKATAALAEAEAGNLDKLNEVIVNIADHWGTTPETSKTILKNWYKDYLE